MKKSEKIYGYLKDGTPLTDALAKELADGVFDTLKNGEGRVLKSPAKQVRIKASVAGLPKELQEAAFYR